MRKPKAASPNAQTDLGVGRRAGDTALKDARLAILAAAEKFRAASPSSVEADKAFCLAYNTGTTVLDGWIYDAVRRISPRTLRRWWKPSRWGSQRG
jgi:hypothetical protein